MVTCQTRQLLRSDRKNSVLSSFNFNISNGHPLVPRCRVILEHLPGKRLLLVVRDAKITSDLGERELSTPPTTLILPPATIEARARLKLLGREARGVQDVAPGRRVTTEERRLLDPSRPPATTNA